MLLLSEIHICDGKEVPDIILMAWSLLKYQINGVRIEVGGAID